MKNDLKLMNLLNKRLLFLPLVYEYKKIMDSLVVIYYALTVEGTVHHLDFSNPAVVK